MATYRTEVNVPTAPEDTFRFLSRFSTTAEWDPGIAEAQDLDGGDPRLGSRYRLKTQTGGIELTYRIVEIEYPHRVVLLADSGRLRSHDTIRCSEAPGGGCVVQYDAELSLSGVASLLSPLLALAFRRVGDRAVEGLMSTLEARHRVAGPLARIGTVMKDLVPSTWRRMRPGVAVAVDEALELSVIGSFSRIGAVSRRSLFAWDSIASGSLAGRTVLVTGATSGLGAAAARQLARGGASVIMTGRDKSRTEGARRALLGAVPGADVRTVAADLSSFDDVRRAATAIRSEADHLDAVINNAGAMADRFQRTVDGLEVTVQTHVAAPFLLTAELLPLLRSTPDARVVTVSSGGMYTQRLDVEALDGDAATFDGTRTYALAKRAQVVLGDLWSRHESGVQFHVMHPGWADTPGVASSLPRFHRLMGPILRSPDEGADTMTWLATAPASDTPGGRFWLDRRPRRTTRLPGTSTSRPEAERLWAWCLDRTGADIGSTSSAAQHESGIGAT